jgi:hypothetical protein
MFHNIYFELHEEPSKVITAFLAWNCLLNFFSKFFNSKD